MENITDKTNPTTGQSKAFPTEQEPVSTCCNAPLYAAMVGGGAERVSVQKCMACGENYPVEKKPFCIDSESRADWLMGKLANIRAEQARITANAQKRIDELESDYTNLYGRFGQQLEAWARNETIARRRKTVTIGNGSIAFRAVPERLIVSDLVTATQTARLVCPAAIVATTTEKLDTAALLDRAQKALQETGEILPGIDLRPADESIKVSPG